MAPTERDETRDSPSDKPARPSARPAPHGAHGRELMLAALGVVYGDIGTSPLYAVRECFHGPHAIEPTPRNVLGVLSLIVWALVIVISIKYLLVVMRADNDGEGGILALMALTAHPETHRRRLGVLALLGLFGAALLYGDGMITPAISVLSAIEGLEFVTVSLAPYVLPITVAVLVGLFMLQRHGTARVGRLFGPLTAVWFVTLATTGALSLWHTPGVLRAINPLCAWRLLSGGADAAMGPAFLVLGTVFLVVTGGEALYADMGHFGARPIRRAWFSLVLPALLSNYFGQAALLLRQPELAASPFYHLAPVWARIPLVVIATIATIIASQAVITGSFSLTWQAQQLGFLPRFEIRHTSPTEFGQIFVPKINTVLLFATVALAVGFGSSSRLASAYGVAVTSTMVITTVLLGRAMRQIWGWPIALVAVSTLGFLAIDLAFFGANLLKIADGGWVPLSIGVGVSIVMTTWRTGRRILGERLRERVVSLDQLFERVSEQELQRVPGTVVFLTGNPSGVPPALSRIQQRIGVVHENVLLLTVKTSDEAYFRGQRGDLKIAELPQGFWRIEATYGFMEQPNVPELLGRAAALGVPVGSDPTYVIGRETLLAAERPGMSVWRERLFSLLSSNAGRATTLFQIPPERVLEIGAQIEL